MPDKEETDGSITVAHICVMSGTGNLRIVKDGGKVMRGWPYKSMWARPDILQVERRCQACGRFDWAAVPTISYEEAGIAEERLTITEQTCAAEMSSDISNLAETRRGEA